MNAVCLVPLRTGSRRLPFKHFHTINDKVVIDVIYSQLSSIFGTQNIIFCIPDDDSNNILEDYLSHKSINYFRGSESNVLARLQGAAKEVNHDWVFRINGDNIIIFRDLIEKVISITKNSQYDLITNVSPRTFPKGCSVEAIKKSIFLSINPNTLDNYSKEHVFSYFYKCTPPEKIFNVNNNTNYSDIELSCDDFKQLELIKFILKGQKFSFNISDLKWIKSRANDFEKLVPFAGSSGVYTIAEIGGNHEGDFEYAKELVELACMTDVDCVKLQIYSPNLLVNEKVDKNRHNHFGKFALKQDQYIELFDIIRRFDKDATASVWSISELKYFVDFIKFIKVGSGDLTDLLMLKHISTIKKPIILSTGLSNIGEIKNALDMLGFKGREEQIGLLQCTSMYPIPHFEANLLTMQKFKDLFGCVVGYSDHTEGMHALKVSSALGAKIQEFHFTDNRDDKIFRDHSVSLTPIEVRELIASNISTQTLLGSSDKRVTLTETISGHKSSFRKGIFLKENTPKGHIISSDDLIALRPNSGISAAEAENLIGLTLKKDVGKLEPLSFDYFEK